MMTMMLMMVGINTFVRVSLRRYRCYRASILSSVASGCTAENRQIFKSIPFHSCIWFPVMLWIDERRCPSTECVYTVPLSFVYVMSPYVQVAAIYTFSHSAVNERPQLLRASHEQMRPTYILDLSMKILLAWEDWPMTTEKPRQVYGYIA